MSDIFRSVSIFVLVTNETDALRTTVETICDSCDAKNIEELIMVFKDESHPESLSIARQMMAKYDDVNILIHFQKAANLYGTIYEVFSMAKGSHVIYLPSDLETDPDLVKLFIENARIFPDSIISASRWMKGSRVQGYSAIKRISTLFIRIVFSVLYCTRLMDITFMYFIYPSALFRDLKFKNEQNFIWEVIIKAVRVGTQIIEIPIDYKQSRGRSTFTSIDLLKRGIIFLWLSFRIRLTPIRKIYKLRPGN